MKRGKAKSLVMQRQYRSRVVKDKTKYHRKPKHKKAPEFRGFFMLGLAAMQNQLPSGG